MPKKTRFGGWQCSDCTEKEDTQSDDGTQSNQSVVDAPRRLREQRKGPDKFVPDDDQALAKSMRSSPKTVVGGKKRGRKKKSQSEKVPKAKKLSADAAEVPAEEGRQSSLSGAGSEGEKKKKPDLEEECDTCKQTSLTKQLVQWVKSSYNIN